MTHAHYRAVVVLRPDVKQDGHDLTGAGIGVVAAQRSELQSTWIPHGLNCSRRGGCDA